MTFDLQKTMPVFVRFKTNYVSENVLTLGPTVKYVGKIFRKACVSGS